MREMLAQFGLVKPQHTSPSISLTSSLVPSQTPSIEILATEAKRRTMPFMLLNTQGIGQYGRKRLRRSVKDLKALSGSALPSRAINLIRSMVTNLDYRIVPKNKDAKTDPDVMRTIELVFDNPNPSDDDLQSFLGPIVEDMLVWDAGCWEYVEGPLFVEANDVLALETVPGYTIYINREWRGDPQMPRWMQVVDGVPISAQMPTFLNNEIEYLTMRRRSWDAFGLSPLEIAVDIMEAWIALSAYQKDTGSNAYPAFMMYLGPEFSLDDTASQLFKNYWEQELMGRGRPGILGGFGEKEPKAIELKPASDSGLYLVYQEMLVATLAYCFGLKRQDFGLERDVNRNTAEVSAEQSLREGGKPYAMQIQRKFNQRVIPMIARVTNNPAIMDYRFEWVNIDPHDAEKEARIDWGYTDRDLVTLDEIRAKRNLGPPLPNKLGALTLSAYREAITLSGLEPEEKQLEEIEQENEE